MTSSFSDEKVNVKDHYFNVYSYWDFIDIMDNNLYGVEKAIKERDKYK